MLLSCAAFAEEDAPFRVGNPTRMQGNFFTEMWGNDTSDIDVRDLLHGYNLIMWDGPGGGMFTVDPTVVTGVAVMENEAKDRSYILVLADDLYYSDGSKITAWDYAFSFLFSIAPEIYGTGGVPIRREHLLGYEEYLNGAGYLSGVRVLADDTLEITIRHEFLPFFYEFGLMQCNPYPIKEIAPGVVVRDDGRGVYLANEDPNVTEPIFTAELLQTTVLGAEGYLSHPKVVSGPYTMDSWDGTTATFTINPYYKGNHDGAVPTIPHLLYTLADNETMVDQLARGEFDLLDKVTRADSIMAGVELVSNGFRMSNYPRIGLSYISFCCERPAVASTAVRQAIAWCLNRDQLTQDYVSGFGLRMDGYYGMGQWMYRLVTHSMEPPVDADDPDYDQKVAEFEALNLDGLTAYTADTARAAAILDADGWRLNSEGIREKNGTALNLTMIYPAGNAILSSFEANLVPNLNEVGIRLQLQPVEMTELLEMYYQQRARDVDMIYLASNFALVFDPSVNFVVNSNGEKNWSYTNHTDEKLYELAREMRETEPGDVLTYCRRWIAFQERFNETLPMLPIYSNIYFDFFVDELQNFAVAEKATWGEAIVAAYLGESGGGAADELSEDEMEFGD